MKFAVIKTGGKQYEVREGGILQVEKLPAPAAGQAVVFEEVLLTVGGEEVTLGTPLVAGAKVEAEFLETNRAKKITILKYKPKTRYRVKRGHRQPFTRVKITKLDF